MMAAGTVLLSRDRLLVEPPKIESGEIVIRIRPAWASGMSRELRDVLLKGYRDAVEDALPRLFSSTTTEESPAHEPAVPQSPVAADLPASRT